MTCAVSHTVAGKVKKKHQTSNDKMHILRSEKKWHVKKWFIAVYDVVQNMTFPRDGLACFRETW